MFSFQSFISRFRRHKCIWCVVSNIRPEAPSRPTACSGEAVCGRFNQWEHFQAALLLNNFCNSFADCDSLRWTCAAALSGHWQTHIGLCLFLRTTVWSSHTLGTNKDVNKETLFQFDVEELWASAITCCVPLRASCSASISDESACKVQIWK